MKSDDILEVLKIEQESFPGESWTEKMFLDELALKFSSILLAAASDGKILAFAVLWNICGELQINDVAVSPGMRRRGIGAALLSEAFRRGRAAGAETATLEVRAGNSPAIALYESLGFKRVGRRKGYYAGGEDAILMDKSLV